MKIFIHWSLIYLSIYLFVYLFSGLGDGIRWNDLSLIPRFASWMKPATEERKNISIDIVNTGNYVLVITCISSSYFDVSFFIFSCFETYDQEKCDWKWKCVMVVTVWPCNGKRRLVNWQKLISTWATVISFWCHHFR